MSMIKLKNRNTDEISWFVETDWINTNSENIQGFKASKKLTKKDDLLRFYE